MLSNRPADGVYVVSAEKQKAPLEHVMNHISTSLFVNQSIFVLDGSGIPHIPLIPFPCCISITLAQPPLPAPALLPASSVLSVLLCLPHVYCCIDIPVHHQYVTQSQAFCVFVQSYSMCRNNCDWCHAASRPMLSSVFLLWVSLQWCTEVLGFNGLNHVVMS